MNENYQLLIEKSVSYLVSDEAMDSVACDAYWPKWNSPWWHMLLLHEMGLTQEIPKVMVERVLNALSTDYLKFFPLRESEIPAACDPYRHIACHCQLGTMHQLLTTYGVDVDDQLPWLRPWYMRCQMDDGGLNCDEAAYTNAQPKSSVVSTLPPLEAILHCGEKREFTADETKFLDRGAAYLISKKLFRTASTGKVIDENWLKLCFPRFYHYDVLRGLSFLLQWSLRLKRPLSMEAIGETVERIEKQFPDGRIYLQRSSWQGASSRLFDQSTGTWVKGTCGAYPLLEAVSEVGSESIHMTQLWSKVRANLALASEQGLIAKARVK